MRLCAILGLAITAAAPIISQIDWSRVPPVVAHYIAPDYNHFGFFPWAAYLVFGMSAGSLIRILRDEEWVVRFAEETCVLPRRDRAVGNDMRIGDEGRHFTANRR